MNIIFLTLSLSCWIFTSVAVAAETKYLSPSDLAATKDGKTLYVACQTADEVMVFDTATEKVTARHPVANVHEFTLSPDEKRLYVVGGASHGVWQELDLQSGKTLRSFPAGHTPMSPRVTRDGKTLFYCNRYARVDQPDVHAVDLASGKTIRSAKALREPVNL